MLPGELWRPRVIASFLFFRLDPAWRRRRNFPSSRFRLSFPSSRGRRTISFAPSSKRCPKYLGQPVSLVYKPGAAGATGAGFVAGSKPDGYTLVGTSQSSVCLLPVTNKDAGYTRESFAPVTCWRWDINDRRAIVVPLEHRSGIGGRGKKNPGKINYASTGTLGISHIAGEAFRTGGGDPAEPYPAQGSGPASPPCWADTWILPCPGSGPSVPHIRAGTMRALIVFQ